MVAATALLLTGEWALPTAATEADASVVVTTAVLGSVVRELVDDRAQVTVLMGNGVDPHDWQPSAQDIETVYGADLIVANGLDLEEGLHDVLAQAEADGVRVFEATDHIELRMIEADGEHAEEAHADEEVDHGPADPHFWVDPVRMAQVVDALAAASSEAGIDVEESRAALAAELTALDQELAGLLEPIPLASRKLVTGHESMGYFADRYGFELVGAVIPGLSSQGEVSARQLAELASDIREAGVPAVFAEIGTPQSVVDAIAAETGVRVVQLPSHTLPDDGSYLTFMRQIGAAVTDALT